MNTNIGGMYRVLTNLETYGAEIDLELVVICTKSMTVSKQVQYSTITMEIEVSKFTSITTYTQNLQVTDV